MLRELASLTLMVLVLYLPLLSASSLSEPIYSLDQYKTISEYFAQVRTSKELLIDFFRRFPKGADLHHHFMGSPSPAALLEEGESKGLCLDRDYSFVPCTHSTLPTANITRDYQKELEFLRAMTVTDLSLPLLQRIDTFFNTFPKTSALYDGIPLRFLNDLRTRAAQDAVQYIETMTYWSERDGPWELFSLLDQLPTLEPVTEQSMGAFRDKLTQLSGFQNQLNQADKTFADALANSDKALQCGTSFAAPGCDVTIRFLHEIHRTNTLKQVFVQMIFAFDLAQQSRASKQPIILGLNIVGPENDARAQQDYSTHMTMFKFLKESGHYPLSAQHISLHAGELNYRTGAFLEDSNTLASAIETVYPQRIGHAVSLADQYCQDLAAHPGFTSCAQYLGNLMYQKNMAVEVPFVSNQALLDINEQTHPLPLYLQFKVPIVLATDDPGILKTNLTMQFVQIAYLFTDVTFDDLVVMARNSLEYSFLPGQSLWSKTIDGHPDYNQRVPSCSVIQSSSCKNYISSNPKAAQQLQHEQALAAFVNQFDDFFEL